MTETARSMSGRRRWKMKIPVDIALHKKSRELELVYEDSSARLSFEYLRVLSPSAEEQGHSPDEAVLQVGKRLVDITGVQLEATTRFSSRFPTVTIPASTVGIILKSLSTRRMCSGNGTSTIWSKTALLANRTIRSTSPLKKRRPR